MEVSGTSAVVAAGGALAAENDLGEKLDETAEAKAVEAIAEALALACSIGLAGRALAFADPISLVEAALSAGLL